MRMQIIFCTRNIVKVGHFLAVMPEEPNSVELKCYYFRAKLASGDQLAAWEGAKRLWVHGKSRPKQCDPLFDAWLKAGELSDEVVWARLLKAFDARQRSLMNYVARKGSDELRPWELPLRARPLATARENSPAVGASPIEIPDNPRSHKT